LNDWLQAFILTFIPLFIVMDPIGNLPVIISVSEDMDVHERRRLVLMATATATAIGLAFLFFGKFILEVLGISIGSFAIAGGAVLFILSLNYIVTGRYTEVIREEMAAVVPIGTPLITGPATITTLLLLATQFHIAIVLVSFILNMLITWAIFLGGMHVVRFMGQAGIKAVSKIFGLLLAAIAVSMVIRGLALIGVLPPGLGYG